MGVEVVTNKRTGETIVVGSLDDNDDGTITVRLAPANGSERKVKLREPNALEYAEIRTLMVESDVTLGEKFPEPIPPTIDGTDQTVAARQVMDYERAYSAWSTARTNHIRSAEGPYAQIVIEIVQRLAGETIGLADLTVDAFSVYMCTALLEVWEAPLGGRAARAMRQVPIDGTPGPVPTLNGANGASPAASLEAEPSSPPGIEPSIP